ncbi:hypothetical protein [Microbulbifer sp.]|uniref:hypothetical protein n=1 Tax=Microbulbifer sp. TaxID=1908541 RepID=UPI003F32E6F8
MTDSTGGNDKSMVGRGARLGLVIIRTIRNSPFGRLILFLLVSAAILTIGLLGLVKSGGIADSIIAGLKLLADGDADQFDRGVILNLVVFAFTMVFSLGLSILLSPAFQYAPHLTEFVKDGGLLKSTSTGGGSAIPAIFLMGSMAVSVAVSLDVNIKNYLDGRKGEVTSEATPDLPSVPEPDPIDPENPEPGIDPVAHGEINDLKDSIDRLDQTFQALLAAVNHRNLQLDPESLNILSDSVADTLWEKYHLQFKEQLIAALPDQNDIESILDRRESLERPQVDADVLDARYYASEIEYQHCLEQKKILYLFLTKARKEDCKNTAYGWVKEILPNLSVRDETLNAGNSLVEESGNDKKESDEGGALALGEK